MRRRGPITEEVANKIYDILVEHVGIFDARASDKCRDSWRDSFVHGATEGTWTEYRISGRLGFGGKVWNNAGRWYVNCYRENEKALQTAIIRRTNAALTKLYAETFGEAPRK